MTIPEKIQTAIDALDRISYAELGALSDDALTAFHNAVRGKAAYTEVETDIRQWTRSEAWTMHEHADTAWPDALETAA